jgi:hypothetical protein
MHDKTHIGGQETAHAVAIQKRAFVLAAGIAALVVLASCSPHHTPRGLRSPSARMQAQSQQIFFVVRERHSCPDVPSTCPQDLSPISRTAGISGLNRGVEKHRPPP